MSTSWRMAGGSLAEGTRQRTFVKITSALALAVHPDGDVSDAGPGVEPGTQRPERAVVGGQGALGEFRLLRGGFGPR